MEKANKPFILKENNIEFTLLNKNNTIFLLEINKNWIHETVVIPNEVQVIASLAFQNSWVEKIIINNNLNIIEEDAFKDCTKLQKIYIPSNVKTIEKNAFEGCKKLSIYFEKEPLKEWMDEPDKIMEEWVEVPDGWIDYHHHKMGTHQEKVTRIIHNSYNPEKCPIYTNISLENFKKIITKQDN